MSHGGHRPHRDVAAIAVLQARVRFEHAARIVASRFPQSIEARRMSAILDVIAPIVAALEHLLAEPE
jgi:hypothetical protein